jgi:hypothetical protein
MCWKVHTYHLHFAEKDHLDPNPDRLSYLMPAHALKYNTTYLTVVKDLTDSSGEILDAEEMISQYVACYRNTSICTNDVRSQVSKDARYQRFEKQYFPLLEGMSMDLTSIQLAWDFHTASEDSILYNVNGVKESTTQMTRDFIDNNVALYRKISGVVNSCPPANSSHGRSTMRSTTYYRIKVPWYLENHGVSL